MTQGGARVSEAKGPRLPGERQRRERAFQLLSERRSGAKGKLLKNSRNEANVN